MDRRRSMAFKKSLAGGAALFLTLGLLSGCHTTFVAKEVYEQAHATLPAKLEQDHCPITGPLSEMTPAPATVNNPERTPRYLTLDMAFAEALVNGSVSSVGLRGGGLGGRGSDDLVSFSGPASLNSQTERLRVLMLQPAITQAAMEASMARFDSVFFSGMTWQNTDELNLGLGSFQNGQSSNFQMGVLKPLATGGVVSTAFLTSYTNLNTPPAGTFATLNPQYQSRIVFGFEQPLLKDWGIETNRLLPRLAPFLGQSLNTTTATVAQNAFSNRLGTLGSFVDRNTEGILISRLRFDQQRTEFESNVHKLIVNTEVAYWNLYAKYGQLYSIEENLRIMHRVWQENHVRFKAGKIGREVYYQILGQYEEFRGERIRALGEVITAERELRSIMGLPVDDGYRLVPITPPTEVELKPNWEFAVQEALNLRPELQLARDNLRYHQYLLSIQKNNLRPDLRAIAKFEPVGFGSTLTGNGEFLDGTGTPRTANAFRSLSSTHYADWTIGLTLNMPLGYRYELAATRAARLELAQSYLLLRDQEEKATRFVASQMQLMAEQYQRIGAHRAERMAYLESLKTRMEKIKFGIGIVGGSDQEGPFAFLEAQRRYSAALVKEYAAIAEYNSALARLEWAKGTILRYNNINISEGALPEYIKDCTVDVEKERRRSFVLKGRPDSLAQPGALCATNENQLVGPPNIIDERPLPPVMSPAASTPNPLLMPGASTPNLLPTTPPSIPTGGTPDALPKYLPTIKPDEREIEFRPSGQPLKAPRLDGPILPLTPTTGARGKILAPDWGKNDPGSQGFVTVEDAPMFVRAPSARQADLTPTLAPVRPFTGTTQTLDFPPRP